MKKFIVIVVIFMALSCAREPEQGALSQPTMGALHQGAVSAEQAGRLGESELALEQILTDYPNADEIDIAREMLIRIRKDTQDAALMIVREVNGAQSNFMATRRRFAITIQELVEQLMLSENPSRSDLNYDIYLKGSPYADRYSIIAQPIAGVGEKRAYFSDETGLIRWAIGDVATADSPVLNEAAEDN